MDPKSGDSPDAWVYLHFYSTNMRGMKEKSAP